MATKVWHKSKKVEMGKSRVVWRHRAVRRFITKIGTWLLGAFVFGIGTSIFFAAIQQPDIAAKFARIVFFIVFSLGVTSAYFRNVVNGLEFRVTDFGLIHLRPWVGIESIGKAIGSDEKPLGQRTDYITWDEIESLSEEKGDLKIRHKELGDFTIPVSPVLQLTLLSEQSTKTRDKKNSTANINFDNKALKTILQQAREANKDFSRSR